MRGLREPMKSPTALALLLLCTAGFLARGQTAHGAPGDPPQADPASDYAPLAAWRALFVDSDQISLGQVRSLFLNQDIVVGGTVEDLGQSSQLFEWRIATQSPALTKAAKSEVQKTPRPARYVIPNALDALPVRYSGKTAKVIAIQLHNPEASGAGNNALGEAVSDDGVINPCFDLVAQFDDGTTAMTTQYPASLSTANIAELASVISAAVERMQRELPSIVGKFVFAAGFTQLYRPDSSVDDLSSQNAAKRLAPVDIPLFEPFEIVAAKYVEPAGVVIEVELPNGDKALSLTTKTQLFSAPAKGADQSFLDQVIGLFLSEIPSELSKKEVAAIQNGSIYRGMREGAVEYVMGFPDKESKANDGSRQLTFRKSLLVYVSPEGTVEDWKFLDAK